MVKMGKYPFIVAVIVWAGVILYGAYFYISLTAEDINWQWDLGRILFFISIEMVVACVGYICALAASGIMEYFIPLKKGEKTYGFPTRYQGYHL